MLPLAFWDLSQSNKTILDLSLWKSRPVITCHCENLDCSSWKSRPFIMKISTVQYEHLDRSTWKCRPFIIKISNIHCEILDCSSWKSRPFIMKILTVHHENLGHSSWKSRPFVMKISTVHHENLDRSSWKSRPFIMKISTVLHENFDHSSWKSRPFVIKPRPFIMKSQLLAKMAFQTNVRTELLSQFNQKFYGAGKRLFDQAFFTVKNDVKPSYTEQMFLYCLTILTGENCVLFNSVQEWLLSFFICLPNQLSSSINFIIMH